MPSLEECKEMIKDLADELGWGNSVDFVDTKLWYSVIELGEAGGIWKHRGDPKWLAEHKINSQKELEDHMAEELIDVIFYALHAAHCLNPNIDMDKEFLRKWKVNLERGRRYIDDKQEVECKHT